MEIATGVAERCVQAIDEIRHMRLNALPADRVSAVVRRVLNDESPAPALGVAAFSSALDVAAFNSAL